MSAPCDRKRNAHATTFDILEVRSLLSGTNLTPTPEQEPNDTLDQATALDPFTPGVTSRITGQIAAPGTDVDWYRFNLAHTALVDLRLSAGVISLYNDESRSFDDLANPNGPRRLAQSDSTNGPAELSRTLAAGTYFVAVSGLGNSLFHPYLAHSGLAGAPTSYALQLAAADVSDTGPATLLAADTSPLTVRLDFATPFAFTPTVSVENAQHQSVSLTWSHWDAGLAELQLAPNQAFAAGTYQVTVRDGASSVAWTGSISVAPFGAGPDAGNDTAARARELGNVQRPGVIQVAGAIGDDPFYDAANPDPLRNPGNDVDLYHFQITSSHPVGLKAEVFAGRIGSPLDAGLSLFRKDATTGRLQFVAGDNQTYNPVRATDNGLPLYFDPSIMAGLSAGDYYLAVSQGANTPAPREGQVGGPGSGLFDPAVSHSGSLGFGVGPYVLNVQVVELVQAPQVVATSLTSGALLDSPPTQFSVQFSQYMDLTGLAYSAYQQHSQSSLSGVYLQNVNTGEKYFPRLTSYGIDNTAQFQLLDRLPNGSYEMHLSGRQDLTNLAGAPLVGNSAGGDYVVAFQVGDTQATLDPLVHPRDAAAATADGQCVGVFYPHELQAGVHVRSGNALQTSRDSFQFEVLQDQSYTFQWTGSGVPVGARLELLDSSNQVINATSPDNGRTLIAQLTAGTYHLVADGQGTSLGPYDVRATLIGSSDNAPPLLSGPAPAISLRLASATQPDAWVVVAPTSGPTGPVQGPELVSVAPRPPAGGSNPVGSSTTTTPTVTVTGAAAPSGPSGLSAVANLAFASPAMIGGGDRGGAPQLVLPIAPMSDGRALPAGLTRPAAQAGQPVFQAVRLSQSQPDGTPHDAPVPSLTSLADTPVRTPEEETTIVSTPDVRARVIAAADERELSKGAPQRAVAAPSVAAVSAQIDELLALAAPYLRALSVRAAQVKPQTAGDLDAVFIRATQPDASGGDALQASDNEEATMFAVPFLSSPARQAAVTLALMGAAAMVRRRRLPWGDMLGNGLRNKSTRERKQELERAATRGG